MNLQMDLKWPAQALPLTVAIWPRKGLRRTSLSRYTGLDAGDEHCMPLKPFWAYCMLAAVVFSRNIVITI